MTLLTESFDRLCENLFLYDAKIKEQTKFLAEAGKRAALADLAHEVAHNIRSPLAALQVFSETTENLPEENRILMQHATVRIMDIADNLIERTRSEFSTQNRSDSDKPHFVSGLIHGLVAEKRISQGRHGIQLIQELKLHQSSILVTSRQEDPNVFEECTRLKIRMIPKELVKYVAVRIA